MGFAGMEQCADSMGLRKAQCQSDSHAERTSGEWIPSGRQVGTLLFPPVPALEVVQG